MESNQATEPVAPGNPSTAVEPAKAETVLTGASPTEGTAPLATGTAPELPRPWMNGLTTEQKANADLVKRMARFERGIPDLAEAYVALEQKADRSVLIPGEKATPEEKAAFRKAIGVPDKPEDYKPEKLTVPYPEQALADIDKSLIALAHDKSLSKGQFEAVRKWHVDRQVAAAEKVAETYKTDAAATMKVLQTEFGAQFPAVASQMKQAYQTYAPERLRDKLTAFGLANDADMAKVFIELADMARKLGRKGFEATFVDGRGTAQPIAPVGQRSNADLGNVLFGDVTKPA